MFATFCDSYKILVLFTHPGKSHFMIYSSVFTGLASRGHNVTVVSYSPSKEVPIPNYRDISLSRPCTKKGSEVLSLELFKNANRLKWLQGLFILENYIGNSCSGTFEVENFQNFLKEDHDYDVVLMQYFISECFTGLLKKINAPVIGKSLILLYLHDKCATNFASNIVCLRINSLKNHESSFNCCVAIINDCFIVNTLIIFLNTL